MWPIPTSPAESFDPEALEELAESIRQIGVIQPITLRKMDDGTYQIIAGERRWRASQMAGLLSIPAYVRTADDENMMQMALVENIQREDLNAIEIALAYQNLIEQYDLTQDALSEKVGKKRATIANYLRLLKLPAQVQMALQKREMDQGHARALLGRNNLASGQTLRRNTGEGLLGATGRRHGQGDQCRRHRAERTQEPERQKRRRWPKNMCRCANAFRRCSTRRSA